MLHCDLQERYGLTVDLFERLPNWEDRTGSRKVHSARALAWAESFYVLHKHVQRRGRCLVTLQLLCWQVWQYWREDIVQIVQEVYGLPSLNALVMQRRMQAAERQRAAEERKREAAEKKRLVQKEG